MTNKICKNALSTILGLGRAEELRNRIRVWCLAPLAVCLVEMSMSVAAIMLYNTVTVCVLFSLGDQNSSGEEAVRQPRLTSFFTLKVVLSVVVAGDYTARHVSPADQ